MTLNTQMSLDNGRGGFADENATLDGIGGITVTNDAHLTGDGGIGPNMTITLVCGQLEMPTLSRNRR